MILFPHPIISTDDSFHSHSWPGRSCDFFRKLLFYHSMLLILYTFEAMIMKPKNKIILSCFKFYLLLVQSPSLWSPWKVICCVSPSLSILTTLNLLSHISSLYFRAFLAVTRPQRSPNDRITDLFILVSWWPAVIKYLFTGHHDLVSVHSVLWTAISIRLEVSAGSMNFHPILCHVSVR